MQTAELRLSLEDITPDRARHYLTRNRSNRPIKEVNVRKLKNDLISGNFKLTHQGIAFDWNGNLIDGQHRLMAIAEAGVATKMYVTYNCDPENFKLIDCGSARTSSDVLKNLGAANYAATAASIRLILWAHEHYAVQSKLVNRKLYKSFSTTNAETAAFYEKHKLSLAPLMGKSTAIRSMNRAFMPPAVCAFLFLAQEMHGDIEVAYDFIHRSASGANLSPGSVELALSKFVSVQQTNYQNYKKGEYMLVAYIRAFNRYIRGDAMLQFRVGHIDGVPAIVEI